MVTLSKYGAKYNRSILFLEGLSTDTKPTGEFDGLSIQNGSEYTEVDTGKKFLFDYDNATWYEVQTGGGGGGGGGTSNYNDLSNRPSVNNTVLTGNKTSAQLGLASSEQGGKADSAIQGVKLNGGSVITPDANNIVDISVPITAIQKNGTGITPVSGTVNITVPTQASDINAATATQGGKADTAIQGIKVNSSTVNPDANKVVSITVPTSAADVSALPDTTKYAAALSLTINSSTYVMTGQLKDQNGDNLGTAQTIDLPLESVVVGGSYNSQTKKVVLTLQNGNTIEFSVADLVSGLQTELSASNKLNPAYINYDSTHRAVSDTEKSTWNSKQSAIDDLTTIRSGAALGATAVQPEAGKGLSSNDYTTAEKTKLDDLANIKSVGTGLSLNSSTGELTVTGGGGTSDYTALSNKPQIAGITLTGNKSLSDLGIAPASAVTLVSGLNTTGTIKNGSSETSTTGYTASPIISGVPYYKDTTYESKSAVSSGTAVSLCTTGEKYTWNNKQSALSSAQLTAVNSGIDSTKVAQIETNSNNISTLTLHGSKSNDVDNVVVNEFAMYGSTAPNLPTDAYTIVRTSIYSATAALQEAFVTSTGDAYVRTKAGGVWGTWKKMTP